MKRIVYMLSGALAVVIPVINDDESITEQEAIDRAMARIPQEATDVTVLDASAIPASREFRSAWVLNGGKTAVVVDATLAAAQSVPQEVTMRQARLALAGVGLLDAVNEAIAKITDPATRKAAQIEWEYSATVQRDRQFVALLAPALGLSDQMLDQLFIAAAAL